MRMIYREEDGDLGILANKRVGVIGYGNMGRPIAHNLRDNNIDVLIGIHTQAARDRATEDGFPSDTIEQVTREADILMLLLRDEVMPQVYIEKISPHLKNNQMLAFASGYNIRYGFIEPPSFVDVALVAPRAMGAAVRERFISGEGFYSFISVAQDANGDAWPVVLALAKAIGALKAGALEVSIEQEAELDLFMQQAILPFFHQMMMTAAKLLTGDNYGYPPEATMIELYISGELNDYLQMARQAGMLHALRRTSLTAQYGLFSRLQRFDELKLERLLEAALEDIRNGDFAQEWAREYSDGYPRLHKLRDQHERLDLWDMEQQTIELLNVQPYDEIETEL